MKFSIIIPTLNEAANICNCLFALQALRKDSEIIVVDSGSSDNTRMTADNLADHILIAPQGHAHQMNQGARHSQGEIFIFLHADTNLPDNALALIAQHINLKQRWPVNFGLAAINMVIMRLTVSSLAYLSAIDAAERGLGLLN